MKVLVTGATGFIGHHLVQWLCSEGHEVSILARSSSDLSRLPSGDIQVFQGDILAIETLEPAVRQVECVFHLASLLKVPWKPEFRAINVEGTRNIAEACARAEQSPVLVIVSSLAAAGPSEVTPRIEKESEAPVSIYGRTKRDAELVALAYADRVPISVVRPPMVFGEGDTGTIPLFRSLRRGVHIVPVRKDMMISSIHVVDLCHALMVVGLRGSRHRLNGLPDTGIYYAAADEVITYIELGETIAHCMGNQSLRVLRIPGWLLYFGAVLSEVWARVSGRVHILTRDKWREATAGHWTCDSSRLKALGWRPLASLRMRLMQATKAYLGRGGSV